MSLATHSLEMQLIHMRLVVSSALPTILPSQQFFEVPHARTPQSIAHNIVFHLPTTDQAVYCPVPTLHQNARSAVTLEPWSR